MISASVSGHGRRLQGRVFQQKIPTSSSHVTNSSFQYQSKETLPCFFAPSGRSDTGLYLRDVSLSCLGHVCPQGGPGPGSSPLEIWYVAHDSSLQMSNFFKYALVFIFPLNCYKINIPFTCLIIFSYFVHSIHLASKLTFTFGPLSNVFFFLKSSAFLV